MTETDAFYKNSYHWISEERKEEIRIFWKPYLPKRYELLPELYISDKIEQQNLEGLVKSYSKELAGIKPPEIFLKEVAYMILFAVSCEDVKHKLITNKDSLKPIIKSSVKNLKKISQVAKRANLIQKDFQAYLDYCSEKKEHEQSPLEQNFGFNLSQMIHFIEDVVTDGYIDDYTDNWSSSTNFKKREFNRSCAIEAFVESYKKHLGDNFKSVDFKKCRDTFISMMYKFKIVEYDTQKETVLKTFNSIIKKSKRPIF